MIRVLHVDSGRIFRGGQEQLYLHLKHLGKFGVEQYLACSLRSGLQAKSRDFIKNYWALSESNLGRFFQRNGLASFIRTNEIQLIHAHDSHAHSLAVLLKSTLNDIRIIVTRRSSGPIGFGSRTKYAGHEIKYIAISGHVREELLTAGIKADDIELIPSMIDANELTKTELPGGNTVSAGEKKIISMGAFDKEKGFLDALYGIKRLRDAGKFSGYKFYLVGDGPERRKIEKFISHHNISDIVVMTGWADNTMQFLNAGDIYLAPSHSEGLGIGLLKAMGAGMAVVASDIPPHRELVENGLTGLLFTWGEPAILAEKVGNLIENPELTLRLGTSARNFSLKFDAGVTSERIYRLYCKVCQRR